MIGSRARKRLDADDRILYRKIGERLTAAMQMQGVDRKQLSERTRFTPRQIEHFENGGLYYFSDVSKLAVALEVSVDWMSCYRDN